MGSTGGDDVSVQQIHTARTEDWRYIRYANGDEELYHDAEDPYEWTNLALKPEFAAKKVEMVEIPAHRKQTDIGGAKDGTKKKKNE